MVTRVRLERFRGNFAASTASRAAIVIWLVNELVILPVRFIAMRALIYISVVVQSHVVNVTAAMAGQSAIWAFMRHYGFLPWFNCITFLAGSGFCSGESAATPR